MELQDKTIRCATCGRDFLFTVKEQSFFSEKKFKEPRHCRECRQQRKQQQMQSLDQLTGQSQQRNGKETFKVVCGNCQRETFVPFKPITGKPVLCKDCFIAQRYGAPQQSAAERVPAKTDTPQASVQELPEEGIAEETTSKGGSLEPPHFASRSETPASFSLAAKAPEA